jgi:undecaprenyl pyrophosphate phosphatase UppP
MLGCQFGINSCKSPLQAPLVVGLACFVIALLMSAAERFARHRRDAEELTLTDALFIGIRSYLWVLTLGLDAYRRVGTASTS